MRVHRIGRPTGSPFVIVLHPAAEKEFFDLSIRTQERFERALDTLQEDPFRPRPGADIKKLGDLGPDEGLYRLRVGENRACYVVLSAERQILVLLFESRERGYNRIVETARSRRGRR